MRQTTMANAATIERQWFVVDAAGMTLGRLASAVATVLRGKHKPTYTPHVDCGDYVIILNSDQVVMTGNKLDKELYYRHTGYPGGLRTKTARQFKEQDSTLWVEAAVKGMLPHNRLGKAQGMKLFVYKGSEHPHAAQKPQPMAIKG